MKSLLRIPAQVWGRLLGMIVASHHNFRRNHTADQMTLFAGGRKG